MQKDESQAPNSGSPIATQCESKRLRTAEERRTEIEHADAVRKAEAASMDAEGRRRQAEHKAKADAIAAGTDDDKRHRDTARYEALAREHGADLSEEGFNEALRKIGRKPV